MLAIQLQQSNARWHCRLSDSVDLYYSTIAGDNNSSNDVENVTLTKNHTKAIELFGVENVAYYEARKCICDKQENYCFVSHGENMCSVKRWGREKDVTLCYKSTRSTGTFFRQFWFPIIFFMTFVIIMPFGTVIGRNAMGFLLSPCFPCLTERRIDRMVQNEVNAITQRFEMETSFDRDDGMVELTVLKLRKKSVPESTKKNEDRSTCSVDEHICLICMATLDEGEIVGDLSCGHSYHVDCLKEWLKRKNACPLCNTQVADPQTVLVSRDEILNNAAADDDDGGVDEEARNRFELLLNFYSGRTTRSMHTTSRV